MRPSVLALIAGSVLLSAGGCSMDSGSTSSSGTTGTSGTAVSASTSVTQTYIQHAGMSDLFEVESSKLALERSGREDVKAFARMMVEDHGRSTEKIKAAVARDGLPAPAPPMLDATHLGKLNRLRSASGEAFDQAYLDMQLSGHKDALALHRSYARSGSAASLRTAAGEIVPVVEQHLQRLTAMTGRS